MMELAAQRASMNFDFDSLAKAGYVIAGSPDDVAEQLENLASDLRVGNLMCGLQMGNMPRDKVMYNTQMFAERVAPKLRSKWSEYEDRWAPNPLPAEDRAKPIDTQYIPGRPMLPLTDLAGVPGVGGAGA
jgi:hypothetical protein